MTYPNESWGPDGAIEALDGTTDVLTGLPYIAKGTGPTSVPSYEVQYNRRERRLNSMLAGWRQGMVVDEGGLKIGVYPIQFTMGGARRAFAGATGVSVPDDSNKVVYLDSAVTLQIADLWPTDLSSYFPLATVDTAGGLMTVGDQRVLAAFCVPLGEGGTVYDRWVVTAHRVMMGNFELDTEIFKFDPREDLTLEEVQVYCSAVSPATTVDVKEGGASVLSAPATPVAGGVVKPVVADGSISAANNVTVHVTTDEYGTVNDLTVTLLFKAAPAA